MKNFSALMVSLIILIAPAAAADTLDWDINDLDEPTSLTDLGNNSTTSQIVRLVEDSSGDPISPENFTSKEDFEYNYSGSIGDMEYLQNGYWYANFTAVQNNTTMEYQLIRSDGSTTTEENRTETFNVGNLTVEFRNDFKGYVKPGEEVRLKANVTDAWNDTNEENADVDAYVTNGSWSNKLGDLGYSSSEELYSLVVEMPEQANSSYVLHINATSTGQGYNDSYGSTSNVFDTYSRSTGKIEYLNASSGCNNSSFFNECARGASIDVGYNMTVFDASAVELAIKAPWENGTMKTLSTKDMSDNGLWETTIEMPDLNTSKYQEKISLVFNASVNNDQLINRYNISYATYKLSDASENSVQTTQDFDMRISIEKPFTGDAVDRSRLNEVNATVYDPNGDVFKTFSLSELEFYENTGFYGKDVYIPNDAENGTYKLNVTTWDIYNLSKTFEEPFTVGEIGSTFNTTGDIDFEYMDFLAHEKTFNVTNLKSTNLTLNVTLSDGIENITTVNDGENLSLNASSTENFTVVFKPDEIKNYDGEIVLTDESSSFEEEIQVELNAPDCEIIDGRLCIDHGRWINATAEERGTVNKTLMVKDYREGNVSVNISEITDEGSSFEVSPADFQLNETKQVTVGFKADEPGNFTGKFEISTDNYTVEMWTSLTSNVEAQESSVSIPSSIDLGAVTRGNDVSKAIEVENTGDLEVQSLSVESSTYDVLVENITVKPGRIRTADLKFSDVQSGSGQITIVSKTSDETIRTTVPVSTTLSSPYIDENDTQNSFNDSVDTGEETEGSDTDVRNSTQSSSSSELLVPIAASVFIILLAGFVLYTSYIPEEGDPLYSVLGE